MFAAVTLLVAPWIARNIREYGEPTGTRAIFNLIHDIYWQRLKYPDSQLFTQFPPGEFVGRSFRSFWALFGWATVWLDDWVYWVLGVFALLALAGLLVRALRARGDLLMGDGARLCLLAALTCLFAFANYVAYNSLVEFQPHIRYTFVALAAATLLFAVGLARGPWGERVGRALSGARGGPRDGPVGPLGAYDICTKFGALSVKYTCTAPAFRVRLPACAGPSLAKLNRYITGRPYHDFPL
jgi:hypothetical protein